MNPGIGIGLGIGFVFFLFFSPLGGSPPRHERNEKNEAEANANDNAWSHLEIDFVFPHPRVWGC